MSVVCLCCVDVDPPEVDSPEVLPFLFFFLFFCITLFSQLFVCLNCVCLDNSSAPTHMFPTLVHLQIKAMVQKHFVFWQRSYTSEEGTTFVMWYHVQRFPYVCVVDPLTGANIGVLPAKPEPNSYLAACASQSCVCVCFVCVCVCFVCIEGEELFTRFLVCVCVCVRACVYVSVCAARRQRGPCVR